MGAPRKADWREARRRRAWELKQQGWRQKDIAQALGVSEGAVCQWIRRAEQDGETGLASHPPTGPKSRLNEAQRQQIPGLLAQGAEAFGFRGDVWTSAGCHGAAVRGSLPPGSCAKAVAGNGPELSATGRAGHPTR